MGRFSDRVVVITGATSGIGLETARAFVREGARVVGTGRDPDRLAALAPYVAQAHELEVTDSRAVQRFASSVLDAHGRVDILVNNAGRGLFKSWDETSLTAFKEVMEVNLFGVVRVTEAFLPAMLEAQSGAVLNIASVAGERGYPKHTAYCSSKHALLGYTRALRKDLRDTGVHVGAVCPPAVRTPFFENAGYFTFDEDHPSLELMTPQTVAQGILDAAHDKSELVILGRRAQVLWALDKFAPSLVERLQRAKA